MTNDIFETMKQRSKELPGDPGVYRFSDHKQEVIYVGKAKDLKRRVSSYFNRAAGVSPKVLAMVKHITDISFTVTRTENEAFLLESNFIKELRPRYNIVLRDDKSYPYIYVETDKEFPKLTFHRGARNGAGKYYGPYPNAGAVRGTMNMLQKLFLLRQCEDSYFKNRNRPCLQHQIQRCTAPCVGLIDQADYEQDVERAVMFLEGNSDKVIDSLTTSMDAASAELAFERAAHYRDQIERLQKLQSEQYVANQKGDFDIIACARKANVGCVQVFFVRNGRHLGNKEFYPAHIQGSSTKEILGAFIPQFYLAGTHDRDVPANILISEEVSEREWLSGALSDKSGHRVEVKFNPRGDRAKWLEMASRNASIAVDQRLASNSDQLKRMQSLQDELSLPEMPKRMECFDISHTSGESTVASCVVFDENGPRKSDYRRFNIKDVVAGDDYAAMEQALLRRYTRIKKEDARFPDILFIDGGKGQVGKAISVLEELQIEDIIVIGVAKGTTRKPGLETLILAKQKQEVVMQKDSGALLVIQHIRDEAHRFAISAHRQARAKTRNTSPLEKIPGVGAKRRQQLVRYFGGLQGVLGAGVDDLQRAPGISRALAQKIYDELHSH